MRVVVAMSGGVDSSVAAALLKEEGHQVIGVTMQLWPRRDGVKGKTGCCGLDAIEEARKVARRLAIPHYVMDFRDVFARLVIEDFCREYLRGRTPNPCIRCNRFIKFDALWEKAAALGAEYIATGHYARIETSGSRYLLKKGSDKHKDQSYFLYCLTPEQLGRTLFPVGNLTKERVRQIAAEMGLTVVSRPESQEICFVPDDDHAAFIKGFIPEADVPGPILNGAGNVLGRHQGIASYTVGQRRGLGIAAAEPVYVTAIRPEENTVVVGPKEQVYGRELVAGDINWISAPPLENPVAVKARIRYRQPEAEAMITPIDNDNIYVKFAEPQMAITPGQAVVFYQGETVVGGGTIIRPGR